MAALADRCLHIPYVYILKYTAGGSDVKSSGSFAQGSCQCHTVLSASHNLLSLFGTLCCVVPDAATSLSRHRHPQTLISHIWRITSVLREKSLSLISHIACCSLSSLSITHELPGNECPLTYFTSTDSA